jgi:hypothetical protein
MVFLKGGRLALWDHIKHKKQGTQHRKLVQILRNNFADYRDIIYKIHERKETDSNKGHAGYKKH